MPDDASQRRGPIQLVLVPRRIEVHKDAKSFDTILRMEVDGDIVIVPIGPKLVSTLIDGLQRAQQMTADAPTKQ